MARVYLDVCCLNRPFDDQSQDRIRLESEAVRLILARIKSGEPSWVVSEVMEEEIERTADPVRRGRVRLMLDYAATRIALGDAEVTRGEELEALGFQAYDALHLACAEAAAVDVFLTTDDRLLRTARRAAGDLRVRV
ncbi:MAG TPA: PIN domain-containing protein, partial [Isosphaeraceae bacterium]